MSLFLWISPQHCDNATTSIVDSAGKGQVLQFTAAPHLFLKFLWNELPLDVTRCDAAASPADDLDSLSLSTLKQTVPAECRVKTCVRAPLWVNLKYHSWKYDMNKYMIPVSFY